MIVVTGAARTGTSMMMQTLKLLGVEVPVPAFSESHEEIKEFNPKGFYEFKDEDEVNVLLKDKAIKLFGGQLSLRVDQDNSIDKIIVCLRNKVDAVKSAIPVYDKMGITANPDLLYELNYDLLFSSIKDFPTLFVKFEDITTNPKQEIERVVDFLNIKVSEDQIQEAVKNID